MEDQKKLSQQSLDAVIGIDNHIEVRELPGVDVRVETGVIRFGEDWPGIFIRGDSAFNYANMLEIDGWMSDHAKRELIKLLRSCDMRHIHNQKSL